MKFSIFMMPLHHPTENPSLAFDRDISLIHYAEELGYDEFFIGEHHSGGWETMIFPGGYHRYRTRPRPFSA